MIGGVDATGADCSNELSYLFLHVIGLLQLSSPTLGPALEQRDAAVVMNKAIRTNMATKGGIPLFENDEVVIFPFCGRRRFHGGSRRMVRSGFVYPCLPLQGGALRRGRGGRLQLAAMLHLVLHNGVDINGKLTGLQTGDPAEFRSFDELYMH